MLEQGSIDKSVNDFFTNMKQPQLPYGFYRTFSLWRRASAAGDGLRRSTARTYDENTLAVVHTSFPPLLSRSICHPAYLPIHIISLDLGAGSMRPAWAVVVCDFATLPIATSSFVILLLLSPLLLTRNRCWNNLTILAVFKST